MTIIYLYRSLAAFGGVERIFIDKANYLAEHYGYHVYIITWEQGGHSIVYPLSPKVTHVDWGQCNGKWKKSFLKNSVTSYIQLKPT